jgi:hypothetical protein
MTGHHARPTPSDHLSSAQGLDLDFGRPRARRRIHRGMHARATQLGNNVRFALNQLPALGSSDADGYDTNLKSMFQFDTDGAGCIGTAEKSELRWLASAIWALKRCC